VPYLSAGPADELHTTRCRRRLCGLIAASALLAPHYVSRLYAFPAVTKVARGRHARGGDGPVNPNGVYPCRPL